MKIIFLMTLMIFGNLAHGKTCKEAADELLKSHEFSTPGTCPKTAKKCSFDVDSQSGLPAIDISFKNGKTIKTKSSIKNNAPAHWYFEVVTNQEEHNSFPIQNIIYNGTNTRTYDFTDINGRCSLQDISVKFLAEGKNETASVYTKLDFNKCKKLSGEYQEEKIRYQNMIDAKKNVLTLGSPDMKKYGELCSNSLEFFPELNKALFNSKTVREEKVPKAKGGR